MQEIPIAIETNGSESLIEFSMMDGMLDSGEVDGLDNDLSILETDASMPIAVVGMGFRGPGDAKDVNNLWEVIMEQREAWKAIPGERWNNNAFYHPDHARHGTINVEGGHFLEEDVSLFDAPFFNMTSDEAAAMDPQQRLLLEVTYEGLENAGITLPQFTSTETSCFVGSFSADYTDMLLRDPECVAMYQCTNAGQSRAMTANRISYFYDLKGPSVTVDAACSGSLVALHLAYQSLQTGDATMAVAAGVNLILSHEFMSTMSMMRFLSPDGRCYTFDEKANGYARGEAIGCLILKPLADALRDQNRIRAIIRGTGSNQDGRTPGITLPSGTAQEALIRDVYSRAGLDPEETEVIEAHGTGTQAGDPIETGAVAKVFGGGRSSDNPVRIGSIKTNVGHLEGASGIAGVIKAVLMLENRVLLPSRNFYTPNPRIHFDDWNLKVQLTPEPWGTAGPHRVSVNSFGYGGSNAHVIMEDALGYLNKRGIQTQHRIPLQFPRKTGLHSENHTQETHERYRIFVISAFDEASCSAQVKGLRKYLDKWQCRSDGELMDDLAFTLNEHRSRFMWKTAVVGKSIRDLGTSLSGNPRIRSSIRKPTLGFVFTGQGAQWAGMGKELLHAYPVFRESIAKIDLFLSKIRAPLSVFDELSKSEEDSQLSHPLLSQTICTALQIALVDLLSSWGIYPDSVTGHSSGEIAAAYACHALGVEDATAAAFYRGLAASQLLTTEVRGSMMAIGMSPNEVQPYLSSLKSGKALVACINSATSVTVSGDVEAIRELVDALKDVSVFSRRLAVDVAYHSHHMELVAKEYLTAIEHIRPLDRRRISEDRAHVPFFSSVTGTELQSDELGAQYWVSNLLSQVKFADSLKTLCFETRTLHSSTRTFVPRRERRAGAAQKPSVDCLIEIGPHSALSSPIKQILEDNVKLKSAELVYTSVLSRRNDAVLSALQAASTLASLNYPVDLQAINVPVKRQHQRVPSLLVDLPPYSWNHTRSYWAEPRLSKMFRNREHPRTDLLGAPDNVACPFEPRWRNYLRLSDIPWVAEHKIQSDIVFPAAGYLSIAIEAVMQITKGDEDISEVLLQDVSIQSALILSETATVEIMTSLRKCDQPQLLSDDWYDFHIYSVSKDNKWTEHCTGLIALGKNASETCESCTCDQNGLIEYPPEEESQDISVVDIGLLYEDLRRIGLEYGPCFANLSSAHMMKTGACLSEITIPDTAAVMPMNFQHPLLIHPCTLDSIFHTIFAALPDNISLDRGPLVPIAIESMRVSYQIKSEAGGALNTYTCVQSTTAGGVVASITAANGDDAFDSLKPKLSISGLRCIRLEASSRDVSKRQEIPIAYGIEWKPNSDLLFERDDLSCQHLIKDEDELGQLSSRQDADNCVATLIEKVLLDSEAQEGKLKESEKYRSSLTGLLRQHTERQRLQCNKLAGGINLSDFPESAKTLVHDVMDHLTDLLENAETPDKLLPIWDEYNNYLSASRAHERAARYLQLTGYKRPDISVLEVCQNGEKPRTFFLDSLTKPQAESHSQVPLCSQYSFGYSTDSDIKQSQEQLTAFSDLASLVKIDIASETTDQQPNKASYDIIILKHGAGWLKSNPQALANIKALLKPSGYLMIIDHFDTQRSLMGAVIHSVLYLWPNGIFDIPESTEKQSDTVERMLDEAGFTTREFKNSNTDRVQHEIIFLCHLKQTTELAGREYLIITENEWDDTAIERLYTHLLELPSEVGITDIQHARPENKICIVFSDTQSRLLTSLDDDTLEILKRIVLHSSGVLWITRGGSIEPVNTEAGLILGFVRTARSESSVKPIITLDLDATQPLPGNETADLITHLIETRFLRRDSVDDDTEYAERNGTVLIPRVVERPDLNRDIAQVNEPEIESEQLFMSRSRPLHLAKANARNPQPHFESDQKSTELPPGFVQIEVMAFGLSEIELLTQLTGSEGDKTLGFECSGKVNALGPGVQHLTVGDRVACFGPGAARTKFPGHESTFQKINDKLSYEVAAAIPVAYSVAYYVVHDLARIESQHTVLIDNAADWIGSAIVELCLLSKATVLATVTTSAQRDSLLTQFQITPEQVSVAGEVNTARHVLDITNGRKADVVIIFDKVDNQHMRNLQQSLAPFKRFIQLQTYEKEGGHRQYPAFLTNISFSQINVFELLKSKIELVKDSFSQVTQLFNRGELHGPSKISAHSVAAIEDAMRVLPSEKHAVITVDPSAMVKAIIPNVTHLFKEDASYLLIGGLGGIGRAIALWMADNGAKYLVLVNRSGLFSSSGLSTVEDLNGKGVQVTVQACDISDEEKVREMLSSVQQNQPPIRGVIHGAMILKDIHIERMKADNYHTVLRPRYNGTWNLHKHLPLNLDFFVMLSSISGVIGNATQAAYAAGSAFMDTFAAYRNRLGLPAVSLDLGVITDVGYLASNKELLAKMENQGFQGTDTKTLLSLVQVAILQSPSSGNSQIITGLGEWKADESLVNFDEALFSHFRRRFQVSEQTGQSDDTIALLHESLRASKTLDEAIPLVFDALGAKIAAQFGFSIDRIDSSSPLSEFGVDSHVAVELRNWISKVFESSVSILEILASGSVLQLAAQIASRSRLVVVSEVE